MNSDEHQKELTPEEHVFEAIVTKTGKKVWQYFYTDERDLNQHSKYFETPEAALADYIKKFGGEKKYTDEDLIEFLAGYVFSNNMSEAPELMDKEWDEAKKEAKEYFIENIHKYKL